MNKYSKLLRSDFLILKRDYLKIVKDLNTAVYLSYLIDKYDYFSSNNMITIFDNKEYFFNIQKDIEETIYLSPKQQRSCLDVLIKLKIVKTKLKGIPAKTFFNIDFDLLVELLMNIENTSTKEIEQQDVTKGNNNNLQKGTYITNTKELITNTNNKEEELQKSKDFCPPPDKLTSKGVYEKYIKEGKFNYRGNLFFTDKEIKTLKSKWNADKLEENLDALDNWLNKPKNWLQAKNHYLTVNKWLNDAYNNSLKNGFAYQVDLEWKANNNEKDYTDIDMSKQMLVEDF